MSEENSVSVLQCKTGSGATSFILAVHLTTVKGEDLCAVVAKSLLVSIFLGYYYIVACSVDRLSV